MSPKIGDLEEIILVAIHKSISVEVLTGGLKQGQPPHTPVKDLGLGLGSKKKTTAPPTLFIKAGSFTENWWNKSTPIFCLVYMKIGRENSLPKKKTTAIIKQNSFLKDLQ